MPSYPAFAFFEGSARLVDSAVALVAAFGDVLPESSFDVCESLGTEVKSFQDARAALEYLSTSTSEIERFRLASELHSLECTVAGESYLTVDIWDFDLDVYDRGGPTEEMILAKRQVALTLHSTILQMPSALLSYTSSADDSYAGPDGHFDCAEAVAQALQKGQRSTLGRIVEKPLYLWLLGLRKRDAVSDVLDEVLQHEFSIVDGDHRWAVWEHRVNRPAFLV